MGRLKTEGIYVYRELINFVVQQKLTTLKSNCTPIKKRKKERNRDGLEKRGENQPGSEEEREKTRRKRSTFTENSNH